MHTQYQSIGKRVALAVPNTPLYDEVGAILYDSLLKRGLEVRLVSDGSPQAFEADNLFLAGDVEHFRGFARMLSHLKHRPRTILWQMEPLPPPGITPKAEQLGNKLVGCHWDRRLPRGLIRSLVGWPWKIRRNRYALQFGGEMQRQRNQNWDNVVADNLAYVVRQRNWLVDPVQRLWLDHLYCTTPPRARYLADCGIEAPYFQFGYHSILGQRMSTERDIDVLFLGCVRKTRRASILARLRDELDRRGIKLHIADRDCFGLQRTRLLNRAKIVLNLLKFPWDFPGLRLLMSAGCGAVVVSDTSKDTTPFISGQHFVPATVKEMPAVITHYLHDQQARQRIVEQAYEFVSTELTMDSSLNQILKHVSANSGGQLAA